MAHRWYSGTAEGFGRGSSMAYCTAGTEAKNCSAPRMHPSFGNPVARAKVAAASNSEKRPSPQPMVNVRASMMRAASRATRLESTPAERKQPTSTSAMAWAATDSRKVASMASALSSRLRLASGTKRGANHRPHSARPSRHRSQWPAGNLRTPSNRVSSSGRYSMHSQWASRRSFRLRCARGCVISPLISEPNRMRSPSTA